ncbi:MAG TPA: 50S ribosomal protein L20 [Armatimonadota bacterium]|nr:50S ribosomal protein L20 [Armatimonadota bacterium]HOS43647.1 50S ribosomal protein L20 [Armatimonadota bacterium]
MSRVKRGVMTRKRHKRILKAASGYWGQRHRVFRRANEAVIKAMDDAFRGRKQKKRDYRKLWIARINAACRLNGTTYNQFIHGLALANIQVNRKNLAEVAIHDPAAFTLLVQRAKDAVA